MTHNGSRAYIIAEIGKNQIQTEEDRPVSEYLSNAKELVHLAHEAGADCVKFQTHRVYDEQLDLDVTSPHFKGSDRYSWVARNTMATPYEEFWVPLKDYAKELGVSMISTPMSRGAAEMLERLGVPFWKIGSGDILDFVTLDYIAQTGKPVVFSSGMSTLEETEKAVNFLLDRQVDVALLHCVSQYPCPPDELHLSTIEFFKERFPSVTIGFSDHSIGYESAVATVALGAQVIEKHFSLSRDLWGADHKVSMTPEEFKTMVDAIRNMEANPETKEEWLGKEIVQKGLGDKNKVLGSAESAFRQYFRKSLVAGQDISAGTVITSDMVYAMRPQAYVDGLPSEEYEAVIGNTAVNDLKKYDPITSDVLLK
jgi:sialic acid synthase SpsE